MLNELEIKRQYNQELKRWMKYEAFCEANKDNIEEILKWIPEAQQMTYKLSAILNTMKQNSISYKETELLYGFLM